jgi:hypothetical protein
MEGRKMKDPWENRARKMICLTCIWFVEKQKPLTTTRIQLVGRCRRHAPTMNGYPVVYDNDWCGDHKLNENITDEALSSLKQE